ncbi:UNVERIFIED_CONTAM: hypothetical protein Slati_2376600 [Sesamum latifolium]|uniref:Uncharacterized protein n=1 Tax=Sesamum latifolium TaxID=2727402 RepID=A0AAW2WCB9_9LAMI
MEEDQAYKKEGRGEKMRISKRMDPQKYQGRSFVIRNPLSRGFTLLAPLNTPTTQALMAVEKQRIASLAKKKQGGPARLKSNKYCRFHNDYWNTTDEYQYLKTEMERLTQNGYLREFMNEKLKVQGPTRSRMPTRGKFKKSLV